MTGVLYERKNQPLQTRALRAEGRRPPVRRLAGLWREELLLTEDHVRDRLPRRSVRAFGRLARRIPRGAGRQGYPDHARLGAVSPIQITLVYFAFCRCRLDG